jgi:hypothetical protein
VNGGVAIGTYAGTNAAPSNGLIISGAIGVGTTLPLASLDLSRKTDAIIVPQGATEPTSPIAGMMRYNTATSTFEGYDGTGWYDFGGALGTFNNGTAAAPGWAVTQDTTSGLFQSATTGTLSIAAGGKEAMRFLQGSGTVVNYLTATGASTSNNPVIAPAGTDTNISLTITPKGSGNTIISSGNVGIGSTSAGAPLTITKLSGVTSTLLQGMDTTSGSLPDFQLMSDQNGQGLMNLYMGTNITIHLGGWPGAPSYFNAGKIGIGSATPQVSLDLSQKTDAILVPQGPTEPASPVPGMMRYNTATSTFEGYDGTGWYDFGGALGTFNNGTATAPGWAVTQDTTSGLFQSATTGTLSIAAGGKEAMRFLQGSGTVVNYLTATGAATGVNPILAPAGTDTNISLTITPKGTGNTIISSGNVGIGTTSPQADLEVAGSSGTLAVNKVSSGVGSQMGTIYFTQKTNNWNTWYKSAIAAYDPYGNSYNRTGLAFLVNNTADTSDATYPTNAAMVITPSGSVGIGTTAPAVPLEVTNASGGNLFKLTSANGNASNTSGILFAEQSGGIQPLAQISGMNSNSWGGHLVFYSSPSTGISPGGTLTERMRIVDNGNVGIGTALPSTKLQVELDQAGSVDPMAKFWDANLQNGNFVTLKFGSSDTANDEGILGFTQEATTSYTWLGVQGDNVVANGTGLIVAKGGNVGIGTTTPQSKLDVSGGTAIGAGYAGVTAAPTNGAIVQGNVGIGTTSVPTGVTEAVNGVVKVAGTGSEACTSAQLGAIRYNPTGNYFELCSYP